MEGIHEDDWVKGKGRRPVAMGRGGDSSGSTLLSSESYMISGGNEMGMCTVQKFALNDKKVCSCNVGVCSMIGAIWVRCKNDSEKQNKY